jgi:hypothetical protein
MTNSDSFSSDAGSSQAEPIPAAVQQARQQWDEIEQQQTALAQLPTETGVGKVVIDRGYAITCFDARQYLVNQTSTLELAVPALASEPPRCFCCSVRNQEIHISSWTTIFKISKLNFEESDLTHHRILNSLHSLITGCKSPPLRQGEHWKTIGFQSDDPVRDFRAAGMLGLLLPFHLFAKFEELGQKVARISRLPEQEFPLMIVLISFVMTSLEISGTSQILKTGQTFSECWDQIGFLFAGMVDNLCIEWVKDLCDYQHDFDRFQRIANRAKAVPMETVRIGRRAFESKVLSPTSGLQQDS